MHLLIGTKYRILLWDLESKKMILSIGRPNSNTDFLHAYYSIEKEIVIEGSDHHYWKWTRVAPDPDPDPKPKPTVECSDEDEVEEQKVLQASRHKPKKNSQYRFGQRRITEGVVYLKGFLNERQQLSLLQEIEDQAKGFPPIHSRNPSSNFSKILSIDFSQYAKSQTPAPDSPPCNANQNELSDGPCKETTCSTLKKEKESHIPSSFWRQPANAVKKAGFYDPGIPEYYSPNYCTAFLYPADGKLKGHCDNLKGWVCLFSLGSTCRFWINGPSMKSTRCIELASGDCLIYNSSKEAKIYHGIFDIIPGTCPKYFPAKYHRCRISLHFRQTQVVCSVQEKGPVQQSIRISNKKEVQSAVVVIPPVDKWRNIQKIREKHDKAFERWMPHINLLYPFLPQAEFKKAQKIITRAVETLGGPFQVRLKKFDFFEHGSSCTVFLVPEIVDADNENLVSLQSKLQSLFPHCNDLSLIGEHGFHPHLTVGQFSNVETAKRMIREFENWFEEVTFTLNSIFLICRTGTDPFEVSAEVSLLSSASRVKEKEVEEEYSDNIGGTETEITTFGEPNENDNPSFDITLQDRVPEVAEKVKEWLSNVQHVPSSRLKLCSAIKPFCGIRIQVLDARFVFQKLVVENFVLVTPDDYVIFLNKNFNPSTVKAHCMCSLLFFSFFISSVILSLLSQLTLFIFSSVILSLFSQLTFFSNIIINNRRNT
eukprot:TRINITY_DN3472_c0_g1_i7.p1 TRINITY_DN3472_c0_g1~~TRINITY_DN3472_c0_g1_i7.p1  ORF type:complete len:816 (-),score=119.03 TRINITY_DN3472_c0_g1_i7:154-2280(-)